MSNNNFIQQIFQQHGESYSAHHILSPTQQKAVESITKCRTPDLGRLIKRCDDCGYEEISFCSCRNRHCPMCQTFKKEKWLNERTSELLNTHYFHVVFTIPGELHSLSRLNMEIMYDLLFRAVSDTLLTVGKDKKFVGAQIGAMLILHTWTQQLEFHPHVHCVVPAGGMTELGTWKPAGNKFFIPVKILSKVFKGKFMALFKETFSKGAFFLPGKLTSLNEPVHYKDFLNILYEKDWYTYCKKPFGGPNQVLSYLGRYTHRVAISNHRILDVRNDQVAFRYMDNKDSAKIKVLSISVDNFIRRFLQHVLPSGFMKIRYIGIWSNRNKNIRLKSCQKLLMKSASTDQFTKKSTEELLVMIFGDSIFRCPVCHSNAFRFSKGCEKITQESG